jgi:hypothetical protein
MHTQDTIKEGYMKTETEKKQWEKPELVVLAKGELGENILAGCTIGDTGQPNWQIQSS